MTFKSLPEILGMLGPMINNPLYQQLLNSLKDPALCESDFESQEAMKHNLIMLESLLNHFQTIHGLNPENVQQYMNNPDHFSHDELVQISSFKEALEEYQDVATLKIVNLKENTNVTADQNQAVADNPVKQVKKAPKKMKGDRRGWIAT